MGTRYAHAQQGCVVLERSSRPVPRPDNARRTGRLRAGDASEGVILTQPGSWAVWGRGGDEPLPCAGRRRGVFPGRVHLTDLRFVMCYGGACATSVGPIVGQELGVRVLATPGEVGADPLGGLHAPEHWMEFNGKK